MPTLPIPPVPDAFDFYLMGTGSKGWYSIVEPGWPAVLAIGMWLGVPWLVNPLLAGLNVWIAWLFLREVCPARTARLVSYNPAATCKGFVSAALPALSNSASRKASSIACSALSRGSHSV